MNELENNNAKWNKIAKTVHTIVSYLYENIKIKTNLEGLKADIGCLGHTE